MKFLMMWHPAANAAAQGPPDSQLMTDMDRLIGEMYATGQMVMTGGMGPLASRLTLARDQVTITDGPFSEAKEMVGGFCIVETKSQAEAVALARRFVELHVGYGYEGTSELRQLLDPEDYAAE